MAAITEERLGYGFGLLGGGLMILGGLVSLVAGAIALLVGHPVGALGAGAEAIVLFVLGGLVLLFAWLARHDWSGRPLPSGIMLIVTAAVAAFALGLGGNLLALLGALLAFLAGVLLLLPPAERAVRALVRA